MTDMTITHFCRLSNSGLNLEEELYIQFGDFTQTNGMYLAATKGRVVFRKDVQ